jgi:hypothetical protein
MQAYDEFVERILYLPRVSACCCRCATGRYLRWCGASLKLQQPPIVILRRWPDTLLEPPRQRHSISEQCQVPARTIFISEREGCRSGTRAMRDTQRGLDDEDQNPLHPITKPHLVDGPAPGSCRGSGRRRTGQSQRPRASLRPQRKPPWLQEPADGAHQG